MAGFFVCESHEHSCTHTVGMETLRTVRAPYLARNSRILRTRWQGKPARLSSRYTAGTPIRVDIRTGKGRIAGQHCGTGCCRMEIWVAERTESDIQIRRNKNMATLLHQGRKPRK